MASGIKIPDECKTSYAKDLKMDKKYRYILYKFGDQMKEIIIDKKADRCCTYEDLITDLIAAEDLGETRYAIIDFEYKNDKNADKAKIIMIQWAPDDAKVKQKMVLASSADAFKKDLGEGISKVFQASEVSDVTREEIIKVLESMARN